MKKLVNLITRKEIVLGLILGDEGQWKVVGWIEPIDGNGGRLWLENANKSFAPVLPSEFGYEWVEVIPPSVTKNRLEFLDGLYDNDDAMSHEDYLRYLKNEFYVGEAEAQEVFVYWMEKRRAEVKIAYPNYF